MHNNLVEVGIVLLDLIECLLLVDLKHLLLNTDSGSLIFLCFFPQVNVNHILHAWPLLEYSDLF